MCEPFGKADLLSDYFDSKQSRESVDLPLTSHPYPRLTTVAFRSSEVRSLLLDNHGSSDPLDMFYLFLKRTNVLTARDDEVFRRVISLCSFPACWRQATVTSISKGPSSLSGANYRPISITPVLSKVFERLVSVRLGRFIERSGVIRTARMLIR